MDDIINNKTMWEVLFNILKDGETIKFYKDDNYLLIVICGEKPNCNFKTVFNMGLDGTINQIWPTIKNNLDYMRRYNVENGGE